MAVDNNHALQLDCGNTGSVLGEMGGIQGSAEHHNKLNRASERLDQAVRQEAVLKEKHKSVQEALKLGWEHWKFAIFGVLAIIKVLRADLFERLPRVSGYEQKDLMFISDEIAMIVGDFPEFRAFSEGLTARKSFYLTKVRDEEQVRFERTENIREQKVARSDLVTVNQDAKTFITKNVDLNSPLLKRIKKKTGKAAKKPSTTKAPNLVPQPPSTEPANSNTAAPATPAPVVKPAAA